MPNNFRSVGAPWPDICVTVPSLATFCAVILPGALAAAPVRRAKVA